ncbi:MAG: carboxypeptidase regulatory-like domain-containing protein [Planctomycetes bacterium]|nr:carboxypeptidase regulatory-like domain-containing protein [Planctomycetota bacterium]
MPRKALLALAVLVLGAILLLVLSEPPGGEDPSQGGPGAAEHQDPAAAAGLADPGSAADSAAGRTQLGPKSDFAVVAPDPELGIPSFIGRVLLPDGRPAAGAPVQAWGMSGWAMYVDEGDAADPPLVSWEVRCDRDGRFQLAEPSRDGLRFLIRASAEGLPPLELTNLPAMPGRTRDLGELRLRRGWAVRGTVSGPGGEPVQQAMVVAVPELDTAVFPTRQLQDLPALGGYQAVTDGAGRFELRQLPPGRLRLRASGPGYVEGMSASVKAESGQQVDGVEIQLDRAGTITGLVLDAGRQGIGGARLRFDADGVQLETTSSEGGGFRFDAPEGTERARIRAAADGYWPGGQNFRGDELKFPVELILPKLPPIAGYVQDPAGRPVAGASVKLVAISRSRNSGLDPERLDAAAEAVTGADGTFQLSPAISQTWERRFRVVAWSEQHAAGWSDAITLDENDPQPPPVVAVTLSPGQSIGGVVLGPAGEAAAGARVHLRRLMANRLAGRRQPMAPDTRRRSSILRTATADADGRFAFPGAPVGDYRLEAYLPGLSPAESDEFALLESRPVERVLQLLPPSSIEGAVVGELGLLATLRVTATRDGTDALDTTVDGQGNFSIPDVSPGEYSVEVREVDPALGAATFLLGSGEPLAREDGVLVEEGGTALVTLSLDLQDRATVRGKVSVNGSPRPGMSVYLVPSDLGSMADPRTGWRTVARRLRSTSTDFQGEYAIAAIDPDAYWVVVDLPGRRPGGVFRFGGSAEMQQGPTGAGRAEVRLGAGQEAVRDFQLLLGALRGTAQYPAGKDGKLRPAPRGSRGTLKPVGMEGVAALDFQIGRNGLFELESVPAGDWLLSLSSRAAVLQDHPVMIPPGSAAALDLELEPRQPRPRDDGR